MHTSTKEIKCSCQFCNQHIAFTSDMAGRVITCPHCGLETTLFIPGGKRKAGLAPFALYRLRSAFSVVRGWKLKRQPGLIEQELHSIGTFFFWSGIVGAVLLTIAEAMRIEDGCGVNVVTVICVFGLFGQGIVLRALFYGAGEVIRLLRKQASKNE